MAVTGLSVAALALSAFVAGVLGTVRGGLASESILTDQDVAEYPELQFGAPVGVMRSLRTKRSVNATCRVLPGDDAWPSLEQWATLDRFLSGGLVKPDPLAQPCYAGAGYDAKVCSEITSRWADSDLHINHTSSFAQPLFGGISCPPTRDPLAQNCTLGGYPVYVANARSARDVQAAVNFARNHNVRLVVKNTGHDFAGKSSGAGSLSVRTHFLNHVRFLGGNYTTNGYSGPAFKVGSGIRAEELYAAAHEAGYTIVGGEGKTVGWGGGYIQGGGHSPLSSILGMGADHVLSFEVILADGRFVTADARTNTDLFWALRGGGGSTFGVALSVTVKAHPDLPCTISQFTWSTSRRDLANYASNNNNTERADFWAVFRTYLALFPAHADRGVYSYFTVSPGIDGPGSLTLRMSSYFAPNRTADEVDALLAPVVEAAAAVSIPLAPNTTAFASFYPAWLNGFPQEPLGTWNAQPGSRLFPRANWDDPALFNATFAAIRNLVNRRNSRLVAFNIAPTLAAGGDPDNAVNPAWRRTVMHAIASVTWDVNLRDLAAIDKIRLDFTHVDMQKWRDVSPGAGCYLNEADINEPNRQQAFWGTNYPRLYAIKQKYDPTGVFFAETAVGSEDWDTGKDRLGRLCPV